ncbi:ABC transporter permease [Paracoccus sp. 1_MG-2023]|uniref:ABC transporter permease n=1 Tax=unclassified Paracoccus (in: a-proteobacteria) TaxID=2688777 RepID=UPI001C094EDA|nr:MULTISPECIES: ABC transporter permease [unclassified Paracoccus (in: a-proteobacteria)]MBU2958776.1 ABC transporter permease [Paracoccus sp. C2R09]MDO6667769.1 ABC transporter permease [Paracoccus sp. 1_MG-2023]
MSALPIIGLWLGGWALNIWLARFDRPLTRGAVAAIFGLTVLLLWEMTVRIYQVPTIILPAPSQIIESLVQNRSLLLTDFVQTILRGALGGWVIGAAAAILAAIAIDRSPFLQKGLLPIGNFVAALPIVGIAPILVMWFGFDWHSKAAVVVVMVFFPILVNMVAGLRATDAMQRDLMASWATPYAASLWKMRLPAALPFLFNGLKITTTLALIGAIVAEFFGSPTKGMGFRISTAVGRLDLPLVWAEIVVAAIAGTCFYAIVALIERRATFWHPSQRINRG